MTEYLSPYLRRTPRTLTEVLAHLERNRYRQEVYQAVADLRHSHPVLRREIEDMPFSFVTACADWACAEKIEPSRAAILTVHRHRGHLIALSNMIEPSTDDGPEAA